MNQRPEPILTIPALLPIAGNFDRKPRLLDRDVNTIGRARGSDLCLEANEISTLHCIIYRTVDGYRIRDCNSRTGTRVNGESNKNQFLVDGDIINLGPFSFELRIPPALFPRDGQKIDPVQVIHWKNSRRKLAVLALKFRARLQAPSSGPSAREQELMQKAHLLKEKIRSYDHRSGELEAAEVELSRDREELAQDKEAQQVRVQQIEKELAERLQQTEKEIHQHWQEFQQRCKAEEARLHTLSQGLSASADLPSVPASTDSPSDLSASTLEREKQHQRVLEVEKELSLQKNHFQCERQEFLTMKEKWVKDQSQSAASLEEQKVALGQQEKAIRAQKTELLRMMADLKKMQEELRHPSRGDARALQLEIDRLQKENAELAAQIQHEDSSIEIESILAENDRLRLLVKELKHSGAGMASSVPHDETSRQIDEFRQEIEVLRAEIRQKDQYLQELNAQSESKVNDSDQKEVSGLQEENEALKKSLQEKEQFVEELQLQAQHRPKTENDLERYETELNDYRRQLDGDRSKLNKEVEILRERNKELDEAVREMEMELSKERAELARERIRLERVRDETKADMERLQREIAVRDTMAPVQKLRDELTAKQQPPANSKPEKILNDRLKSFRNHVTDTSS